MTLGKRPKPGKLATSFECLNSSLAQWAGKLWQCKVMQETWLTHPDPEVSM